MPPTSAKPTPEMAAELTVTADVPVEVRVRERDFAVLTGSLPKSRLDALIASCGLGAAVPVPVRATVVVPPVAELLVMTTCPKKVPALVGVNPIFRVRVPPAGIWAGSSAGLVTEKVWPETVTWEMTMDFGLGFVMATLLTAVCPMPTPPKSTVPGVTWITA